MNPCDSTKFPRENNRSSEETKVPVESTSFMQKAPDTALRRIEEQKNGICHLKLQGNAHLILAAGLGAIFAYEIY